MLFKFLMYASFLNKKEAFFRPAPISYKRGYYFENQGLMFLKFMFLICGTLLYCVCTLLSVHNLKYFEVVKRSVLKRFFLSI